MMDQAKLTIKNNLNRRPLLFLAVERARKTYAPLLVSRDTALVIEGYPRSGNSFASVAFEFAQQRPVKLAHHRHSPAQVLLAAKWAIPALVLIRNPKDAVLSNVIMHPSMGLVNALRSYMAFYEPLLKVRGKFEPARFEEVTSDFGAVILRVNARFRTEFTPFDHSSSNEVEVFDRLEAITRSQRHELPVHARVARPTSERSQQKAELQRIYEESPTISRLDSLAQALYRKMLESHSTRTVP